MSGRKRHSWSEDDEIIGYYLYRIGDENLPVDKKEIAEMLGMGWNSMGLKISNFRAVDGKGKLNGYTTQTSRIYERYKGMSDAEFGLVGLGAIERCLQNDLAKINALIKEKKS